ncbi:MAG: hypothetical protein JSW10_08235 [Pseudomonadota bacterium]|nr:MAG: hypothetical protein JSW10_08235 [Pseudomonadota bacterium]
MQKQIQAILYPRPASLFITCVVGLIGWVELVALMVFMAGMIVFKRGDLHSVFMTGAYVTVATLAVYFLLMWSHRCPNCNDRVLGPARESDTSDTPSKRIWEDWPRVLLNVLFARRYTCTHCGAQVTLR